MAKSYRTKRKLHNWMIVVLYTYFFKTKQMRHCISDKDINPDFTIQVCKKLVFYWCAYVVFIYSLMTAFIDELCLSFFLFYYLRLPQYLPAKWYLLRMFLSQYMHLVDALYIYANISRYTSRILKTSYNQSVFYDFIGINETKQAFSTIP